MNLIGRRARTERRRRHAQELRAVGTGDRAEQELFDAAFELAEAARRFGAASGLRGSAAATAAALGCVTVALEAQADAALQTRSLALHVFSKTGPIGMEPNGEAARLGRLLLDVDRNLRAAAGASELAHRTASRILVESRLPDTQRMARRRRVTQ